MRLATLALAVLVPATAFGQAVPPPAPPPGAAVAQPSAADAPGPPPNPTVTVDSSYTIGPDDVLQVLYWRDKDTSAEVRVRPDGKITLPLLNDVQAAGLTPDQLRAAVQKASEQFFQDPNVSVVVKEVNSRRVFVTGAVNKPGAYTLTNRTTVLQMLANAGGLGDFAKKDKIAVLRTENGETKRYPFNYSRVIEGRNLEQNIELRPGDTVVIP